MAALEKNTTLTAEAVANLISQFQEKPKIAGFVSAFSDQSQDLEDAHFEVLVTLDLDTQVGEQLDGIGRILSTPRSGLGDDAYRTRLRVEILIIQSDGRIEDLLGIISLLETSTIEIRRVGGAEFVVEIFALVSDPVQLQSFINRAKSEAVNGTLVFSILSKSSLFIWETGIVPQATTTQGWSNITQTSGGALSSVVP